MTFWRHFGIWMVFGYILESFWIHFGNCWYHNCTLVPLILSQMLSGESKNLRIKRLIRLTSQSSDGIGQRQIAHSIAAKKEEREREEGRAEQKPPFGTAIDAPSFCGVQRRWCGCQGKITLTEGTRWGDIDMTSRTSRRGGAVQKGRHGNVRKYWAWNYYFTTHYYYMGCVKLGN